MRLFVAATILCIVSGCSQKDEQQRKGLDKDLRQLIGTVVTLHGPFSIYGKFGPFVKVRDEVVYIEPADYAERNQSKFNEMAGKKVSITGQLLFRHFEVSHLKETEAAPFDYFYFDPKTVKISAE